VWDCVIALGLRRVQVALLVFHDQRSDGRPVVLPPAGMAVEKLLEMLGQVLGAQLEDPLKVACTERFEGRRRDAVGQGDLRIRDGCEASAQSLARGVKEAVGDPLRDGEEGLGTYQLGNSQPALAVLLVRQCPGLDGLAGLEVERL